MAENRSWYQLFYCKYIFSEKKNVFKHWKFLYKNPCALYRGEWC